MSGRWLRCGIVAGFIATSVAACAASPPSAAVTTVRPCAGSVPRPVYSHVVVVFMENRSFGQIIGNRSAPYINGLARACGLATDYHGVTYPSLPNYLAATSGSTFGIRDDNFPAAHPMRPSNIFSQTGTSWQSLQESMPANCYQANAYPYMVKHNPAAYYLSVAAQCHNQDVPLPIAPTFASRYTLVSPNMLHDMHDGTIAQGDAWLKSFVPKVINSAGYQTGSTILVIVWDTDDSSAANRAPAIVIAPQVKPGTTSALTFNHYSLLRLSEEALNLPLLAGAATATSMRAAFHL